ncbi:tyrosinase [Russula compacta]|nr:tyrosinase [Russula compacta]
MAHVVITGAQGGETPGAVAPNRLEINDLIANHDQFSLYIQALNVMHSTPQNDPRSHFGISGIHGLPYERWQGAGDVNPVPGAQFGGYCTHGTVLFPTWHRPYVALYEQVLQQHALVIAAGYHDQVEDRWLPAAQNLRAPFWDWAANSVPPLEVTTLENVHITTPNGEEDVPNPLIKYTFNPIPGSFTVPYMSWPTTIRRPDKPHSQNATTNVNGLIEELEVMQEHIIINTRNLLFLVDTWPAFSNHTPGHGCSLSSSLEAIHDGIHSWVGGHMFDPAYAGFDPIFYLHHANVDRLLSLWAAIHPGVWVTDSTAERGTFTIPANHAIDVNTDLTPFWKSQAAFWTSTEINATQTLGYTYPEFNGLPLDNQDAVRIAIIVRVTQKYGGFEPYPGPVIPPAGGGPALAAQYEIAQDHFYNWAVHIKFKKSELASSFAVLIFLGDVPDDPLKWRTSPSFIGAHVGLVNSVPYKCANCIEQAGTVVEGFVHLNRAIAKRSDISSYDPSVVAPYLKKNLHWRIQGADRMLIDFDQLPSLEVTVAEALLSLAPGVSLPTRGDPQYHYHITSGKAGGNILAQDVGRTA